MLDLSGLLTRLTCAPTGHQFTVLPIPQREGVLLGIDALSRPCLFIEANEKLDEPMLRTACVSLRPNQPYQLSFPDGSLRKGIFHALICEATDQNDRLAFLLLVETFLVQNNSPRSVAEKIVPFFRSLTKLFAIDPARDLKTERQGLWGELFVMKEIKGYHFWAPFWHNEVTRPFDFSMKRKRLEVKTSTSGERIHHFSHHQVYSLQGEEIIVASLLLQSDEIGVSLRDLIEECRAEFIRTPYYLKLERSVRHAGMIDQTETGPKYNMMNARLRLGWFSAVDIPHFCLPEPPGVSQTTYRVDLSQAPQLQPEVINTWLDRWAEVV